MAVVVGGLDQQPPRVAGSGVGDRALAALGLRGALGVWVGLGLLAAGLGLLGVPQAASAAGGSAYVTNFNFGSNSVSQFDVGAGGALSAKTPTAVAAGITPFGVAVSPDGRSVYVTNSISNSVSLYDVGAGGALSAKNPATVATGSNPFGVAVSPDGRSVYVTNNSSFSNSVSQYDVGAFGALTWGRARR